MYSGGTLDEYQSEGIVRINAKGNILAISPQAQHLLKLSNPYTNNLFRDLIFLNKSSLSPIYNDLIVKQNSSYIIKVNTEEKTKYISTVFHQVENDEYILSLYDNSELIAQILELRKQEYHQRLLVSSINDIIFEVSKDGIFLNYWTNKPELLLQPASTFIGKNITDIIPQETAQITLTLIQDSITEQRENKFEYALPSDDGQVKWYNLQIKTIPEVQDTVVIVITDISDKKNYENQYRFSEHKFYQTFHFSGIGTTLTAMNGYLIEGNQTVTEILGYSIEELKNIRSVDTTHPDDREYDIRVRQELIEGKKNYQTFTKRYLHKNGYYIWCSITISLVRDINKKPKFFIVQLIDITEIKRNNELLTIQKKKLESVKAHLESKILQIEESNYIIAHNLLSPISNIKMLVENLKEVKEKKIQDTHLDLLIACCDELDETLEDLNAITTNINFSIDNYQIELCDFEVIVGKIIELKQPVINKKKAVVLTDFQVREIQTHRVILLSIIDQLLDNALQFSDPFRPPFIQMKTYRDEGAIVFSIQDNGLGMDLDKIKPQLFMFKKIFHRGFNTKGLGLNIVKYQIEALGGKIDVTSNLGEGSIFYVKFPLHNDEKV